MKINKLALAKKQLEQMKKQGVKVKFAACGKVMIDGLPFSFSVFWSSFMKADTFSLPVFSK